MQYRADIDGLRAIAILPVVLVHSQIGLLPGGFVGVDVFFVISGYLITRIIHPQIAAGGFSFAKFYARRVRRLFPALAVMLLGVVLASILLLLPSDRAELAPATAASAFYVGNIWFWTRIDYFQAPDQELLLHTWSLGVEEQFYLLFPTLLILLVRWLGRRAWVGLSLLWLASFGASIAVGQVDSSASFYLLPFRGWELLSGALVALLIPKTIHATKWTDGAVLLGLAMLAIAFRVSEPGPGFPAPQALLVCAGTALVLAFASNGRAKSLLSIKPLVLVGKWSYSIYLWHWPVAAIYRLNDGATSSRLDKLAILAIVFALAIASYYLVERPILRRSLPGTKAQWRMVGHGTLGMAAVAGLAFAGSALPARHAEQARYEGYLSYRGTEAYTYQFGWYECFGTDIEPGCYRPRGSNAQVLLTGDSFAAQYRRALEERFDGVEILPVSVPGCGPLPFSASSDSDDCIETFAPVWAGIEQGHFDTAVFVLRWDETYLADLSRVLRELARHRVDAIIIGPTVEYEIDMPRMLAMAPGNGRGEYVARYRRAAPAEIEAVLARVAQQGGARYVSQIALECPGGVCRPTTEGGVPYHFDFGHLTLDASRELVAAMPADLFEADERP